MYRLAPIFLCLTVLPALSEDHGTCDHKHCDHDHQSNAPSTDDETSTFLRTLGFQLERVEDRVIAGVEVIALPVNSIFEEEGKNFVLAQSEEDSSKFERWEVSLGRSEGRFVEAVTGVFPGDRIVSKRVESAAIQPVPEPADFSSNYDPSPYRGEPSSPSPFYGAPPRNEREEFQNPGYRPIAPPKQRVDPSYGNYGSYEGAEPVASEFYVCPHGNVLSIPRCPHAIDSGLPQSYFQGYFH